MTNISPWLLRWPIEIDAKNLLIAWWIFPWLCYNLLEGNSCSIFSMYSLEDHAIHAAFRNWRTS